MVFAARSEATPQRCTQKAPAGVSLRGLYRFPRRCRDIADASALSRAVCLKNYFFAQQAEVHFVAECLPGLACWAALLRRGFGFGLARQNLNSLLCSQTLESHWVALTLALVAGRFDFSSFAVDAVAMKVSRRNEMRSFIN